MDTSREERQRDTGMALTFVPSDLIERAAREEYWTDSDRQHCSRTLVLQALEDLSKRLLLAESG